jgi:hypothetical protein
MPARQRFTGRHGCLGRDVFSRVVYGARISLEVGITVVVRFIDHRHSHWFCGRFLWRLDRQIPVGYLFNVFLAFRVCCLRSLWSRF